MKTWTNSYMIVWWLTNNETVNWCTLKTLLFLKHTRLLATSIFCYYQTINYSLGTSKLCRLHHKVYNIYSRCSYFFIFLLSFIYITPSFLANNYSCLLRIRPHHHNKTPTFCSALSGSNVCETSRVELITGADSNSSGKLHKVWT